MGIENWKRAGCVHLDVDNSSLCGKGFPDSRLIEFILLRFRVSRDKSARGANCFAFPSWTQPLRGRGTPAHEISMGAPLCNFFSNPTFDITTQRANTGEGF